MKETSYKSWRVFKLIPILFQEHEQITWKVFPNRSCRYVYFWNIIIDTYVGAFSSIIKQHWKDNNHLFIAEIMVYF